MCIAHPERITIHTNPERRGRASSDRRHDGCDLATDKNAPGPVHRGGSSRTAAGTTSSCGAAGETQNRPRVQLPGEQQDEIHGEHTVESNTTRGVNQTKEDTHHVQRGDTNEGSERGEST